MHTIIVLAIGFGILGLCAFFGYFYAGGNAGIAKAMLLFLPIWLVGAGINLYIGVSRAGYSIAEEMPMFLLVFTVPAVVALIAWWKVR